jgi:hypothetical protein
MDRLADQATLIGETANGSVEPCEQRSRRVIGDRATVSTAIKCGQRVLTDRGERCSLVGEKLATGIAKSDEIGGISARDRG